MPNGFQPDEPDDFPLYLYSEEDGSGESVWASGPREAFEKAYGCTPEAAGATIELIGQNEWRITSRRGTHIVVSLHPPR
jgi:hypothetical protein